MGAKDVLTSSSWMVACSAEAGDLRARANSLAVLASHAPSARIEAPFSMEADQEQRTLDQVRSWLEEAKRS